MCSQALMIVALMPALMAAWLELIMSFHSFLFAAKKEKK